MLGFGPLGWQASPDAGGWGMSLFADRAVFQSVLVNSDAWSDAGLVVEVNMKVCLWGLHKSRMCNCQSWVFASPEWKFKLNVHQMHETSNATRNVHDSMLNGHQ
jgi:hypothetical protein